jgi:hypothetical protein
MPAAPVTKKDNWRLDSRNKFALPQTSGPGPARCWGQGAGRCLLHALVTRLVAYSARVADELDDEITRRDDPAHLIVQNNGSDDTSFL